LPHRPTDAGIARFYAVQTQPSVRLCEESALSHIAVIFLVIALVVAEIDCLADLLWPQR
jgi:hypothetical protein